MTYYHMTNSDAPYIGDKILLRKIREGFVRNPSTGKIYFIRVEHSKQKAYPVLASGMVSREALSLPMDMVVELMNPARLGIPAGPIPFTTQTTP